MGVRGTTVRSVYDIVRLIEFSPGTNTVAGELQWLGSFSTNEDLRERRDNLVGLWGAVVSEGNTSCRESTPPLSARSSLSTTLRSPRTSSFNFPVSPDLSSSNSSSFSSCKSFVRWTRAAVTVEELVPDVGAVGLVPGILFAPVR